MARAPQLRGGIRWRTREGREAVDGRRVAGQRRWAWLAVSLPAMGAAVNSASVPPLLAAQAETWSAIAAQRSGDLANRTDAERGVGDCRPHLVTSPWLLWGWPQEECQRTQDWPFELQHNGALQVYSRRDDSPWPAAAERWREGMLGAHVLVRWRVAPCVRCSERELDDLVVGLLDVGPRWWVTLRPGGLERLDDFLKELAESVLYLSGGRDCGLRAAWSEPTAHGADEGARPGRPATRPLSYGVPELAARVRADLAARDASAARRGGPP